VNKAEKIADAITDEYWCESTRDTFVEAASKLLQRGWTEQETEDFLSSLFGAVSEEFGN